jgi:hypothetical protein
MGGKGIVEFDEKMKKIFRELQKPLIKLSSICQ